MGNIYFKNEQELFEHLIGGGKIRPHFEHDRVCKEKWIHLVDGNRVYLESGKSAANCLLGLGFWVVAEEL